MGELASRGLETLLKREFEVRNVPQDQRDAQLSLIALNKLGDPKLKLSAKEREDLINRVVAGAEKALPTIKDLDTLMKQAGKLIEMGSAPKVNTLEYWGENAKTQLQLRPIAETASKLYAQAAKLAHEKADALANQLSSPNDPKIQLYEQAESRAGIAEFNGLMGQYDVALSLDKADPNRAKIADGAIEGLKQFDNPESTVQAAVRNRSAKLAMAKGDYDSARKTFDTVIKNPDGSIKPPPNIAQQYEARYFSVVCEILAKQFDTADKDIGQLDSWQKANFTDAASARGVSAALEMLKYRTFAGRAENTISESQKDTYNSKAIAILLKLVKEQPELRGVIFEQVLGRIPNNPDLAKLDPLLLQALENQGETEYTKKEGEKVDEKVMTRAIDAARETIKRKGAGGVDDATAMHNAYVVPYFYLKLGKNLEAARGFIDYVSQYPRDAQSPQMLDQAGQLIAQLRKAEIENQDVSSLYDRFLPLAINPPFNRGEYSYEYALRLQKLGNYKDAVKYFEQVPADDKRKLTARFFEMVALKQRLDADKADQKVSATEKPGVLAQIQTLADQVKSGASARLASATDPKEQLSMRSILVRTGLLAADLALHEQKNPQRTLDLLNGFEDSAKGLNNEKELLAESLFLHVNAYMGLGRTNDATAALVQLLKTRGGAEGLSVVFDLLSALNKDLDKAQANNDVAQTKQLAKNRAQLSGYLVQWASTNPDPKIQAFTNQYKAFDAASKQLAAKLEDDPAKKKAGLQEALKLYQQLDDPNKPDPVVQLGIGYVQFDLGDYKAVQDSLGPLVMNKRLGTPTREIQENGQPKTVDNEQYWEAMYKYLKASFELAKKDPAQATELDDLKTYLKRQYVWNGANVGGAKFHDDFDKLRKEFIPDFKPEDIAASQPVAG